MTSPVWPLARLRPVQLVGLLGGGMARVRPHHPGTVALGQAVLGAHGDAGLYGPAALREIDVLHLGRERVICCFALDGVLVDPGPESSHRTLLEALGDEVPRAILLTHIHFDHAGAAGALVRRWPQVEVWVHERGARHLVDPERLVASARRLYGDDFDRLWGEVVPVPEGNLRVLEGGERLEGFRVAYTPGHASHHVAYLHEDVGDGVRRRRGRRADRRRPGHAAHAAARHRPGGLAGVAGRRRSAGRRARWACTHFGAFDDARSAARRRARGAAPLGRDRARHGRRGLRRAPRGPRPRATRPPSAPRPTCRRCRPRRSGQGSTATGASAIGVDSSGGPVDRRSRQPPRRRPDASVGGPGASSSATTTTTRSTTSPHAGARSSRGWTSPAATR